MRSGVGWVHCGMLCCLVFQSTTQGDVPVMPLHCCESGRLRELLQPDLMCLRSSVVAGGVVDVGRPLYDHTVQRFGADPAVYRKYNAEQMDTIKSV